MLMNPEPEPIRLGGSSTLGIAQIAPTAMKSKKPATHCMTMKPAASSTLVKPKSARPPRTSAAAPIAVKKSPSRRTMRVTTTLLALAALTFTLPAFADEPSAPSAPKTAAPSTAPAVGGPVAPTNVNGLTRINGGLTADGARAAGQSRNVELGADTNAPAAGKPVRPVPPC